MELLWRHSLGLATASWIAAVVVARMGYPPADGLGLVPSIGILAAGWMLGGSRLWRGAIVGLLGLLPIVFAPIIPADLALAVAGLLALGLTFAVRRPGIDPADAERRSAERLRRESARLKLRHDADLIRLAGGVAHEFNNLFTGIFGHANRLRESLGGHPAAADVHGIEAAVARAVDICGQIVAYSGKGTIVRQPIALNDFLREVAADVRPKLPNDPVVTIADGEPVRLGADAVQLRRLYVNLLANAAESHARPGSPIHVRFGVEANPDPAGESRVWFEVADSGTGIDPGIRDRICEPFFTTKAPGRGLGLAAVKGIARAHGGSVAFASSPGGTTVRVELLDRSGQDLIATPPPARRATVQAESKTERDLALVVDDDASVRELAATTLRIAGWTVLTAENGEEALAIAGRYGADLRLIVLDLLMPVMDGQMTLANLRAVGSRVPVVVMSGYSEFDLSGDFAGGPPMAYLRKPFRPPELLECVAELFEKHSVQG